jgi:hypothetical protein
MEIDPSSIPEIDATNSVVGELVELFNQEKKEEAFYLIFKNNIK